MWARLPSSSSSSDGQQDGVQIGRFGHTATAVGCGSIVVFGGVADASVSTSASLAAASTPAAAAAPAAPAPAPAVAATGGGSASAAAAAGGASVSPLPQRALDSVAVLDVCSGAWSAPLVRPSATDGASPGPRAFHSAAPLARGGAVVAVFGGHTLTLEAGGRKRRVFFNDTWLCRQSADGEWEWSRAPIAEGSRLPPKRDMAALVALDADRLLLFGGRSEQQRALNDCWLFDLGSGGTWRQLAAEGAAPPPRKMAALAVLPGSERGDQAATIALYGGERDNGVLDDVWVATVPSASATAAAAALGTALAPVRWVQLRMRNPPPPRFGHTMTAVSAPAAVGVGAHEGDGGGGDGAAAAAADSKPGSSGSTAEQQQQQQPGPGRSGEASAPPALLFVFGGCVDHSSFPFLARSYSQTQELWAADLAASTWVGPLRADGLDKEGGAADESGWPEERMAHTFTSTLEGGVLLLGGRWRDGIRADAWWFKPPSQLPAPATPSLATVGTVTGETAAGRPTGGPASLLQSLLQPLRPREPPLQVAALDGAAAVEASPSELPSNSSRRLSVTNFDAPPTLMGASLPVAGQQAAAPAPPTQQQRPAPWPRLANLQAAGTGLLEATGTTAWIQAPAAVLSSLTTRIGTHLQPGLDAISQRIGQGGAAVPAAAADSSATTYAALRMRMGLGAAVSASVSFGLRNDHVGDLALLGRQLLDTTATVPNTDNDAAGLGFEVLVSAARQHLMSADPDKLSVRHVQLMAADFVSLRGYGLERELFERRRGQEPPAEWPKDDLWWAAANGSIRLTDVPVLQQSYASLLQTESSA